MKRVKQKSVLLCILVVIASFLLVIPAFAADITNQGADISSQPTITATTLDQIIARDNNLSPKVKEEYKKFIAKKASINHNDIYVPTVQDIEEFVDYSASNGIIEDTPAVKLDITKTLVRASMKIVVTAGNVAGYKLASECLDHSLQDYPSAVTYNNGSSQCNIVKTGTAYKNLVSSIKTKLKTSNSSTYSTSGSMVLNSPKDLFLALNKVSYTVNARKTSGTWNITITVKDRYDFEYQDWMGAPGISGAAATALNNYGAYAESIGAIVPYNITINAVESYTP